MVVRVVLCGLVQEQVHALVQEQSKQVVYQKPMVVWGVGGGTDEQC